MLINNSWERNIPVEYIILIEMQYFNEVHAKSYNSKLYCKFPPFPNEYSTRCEYGRVLYSNLNNPKLFSKELSSSTAHCSFALLLNALIGLVWWFLTRNVYFSQSKCQNLIWSMQYYSIYQTKECKTNWHLDYYIYIMWAGLCIPNFTLFVTFIPL